MSDQKTEENVNKNTFSNQDLFDFTETIITPHNEDVQTYLHQREYNLRRSLEKRPRTNSVKYSWALVFVLMASLMGVSVYGVVQIQNQQQKIVALTQEKQAQVAGIREDNQAKNVVTADGFSIVLNVQTPEGFNKNRLKSISKYLQNREAIITSFLFSKDTNNQQAFSGINVEVAQYDNKLSREEFAKQVSTAISSTATISSESIMIPKNIALTEIKTENKLIQYYTAVTADNYYVITLYKQHKDAADLDEVNKFVDTFLQSLYLN